MQGHFCGILQRKGIYHFPAKNPQAAGKREGYSKNKIRAKIVGKKRRDATRLSVYLSRLLDLESRMGVELRSVAGFCAGFHTRRHTSF